MDIDYFGYLLVYYWNMVRRISPIGENLHRLMNREDIKQAELSRIAGVAQSTISRIILGEQRNPSVKIIRALAVALNAKVSDLVPDEEKVREPRQIRDRSEREILQELDAKIKAKEDIVLVPVSSY
jgi:transcriptional regulator with XRE-family HTH domain